MRIHWFQHVPFEGLGCMEAWSLSHGHQLGVTRFYENGSLPAMSEFDWLIVMGGPMNIYEEDRYPWLREEKSILKRAVEGGKVVIGVCLGAQLIADALGSKVYAGSRKEIGWFPIRRTGEAEASVLFRDLPPEMDVFHWHGDTFDLPPGCLHIAQTAACRNQAFVCGDRVIGLQFHLEMTRQGIDAILENCRDEIEEAPCIQHADEIVSKSNLVESANREMGRLLDRLCSIHRPNNNRD